ncbi:unnamed protein product [Cuscuta campestris]|uniref:Formin-like protein n=1 Tax=Cuscuta campestris TaxID=132261 RepID=A0A484NHQ2_9ASTE|nr:unnamed protein product [Cuscuta campestris]
MHRSPALFLLIALCANWTSSAAVPSRRVLHQPFFPVDSPPPVPSPPATASPEYPFTSPVSDDAPFSPPSPGALANVPANATYLSIPRVSQPKSPTLKPIATAIACSAAAVAVIALSVAGFLHFRKKGESYYPGESKTHGSDFSNRSDVGNNEGAGAGANRQAVPKLRRPSHPSSEFLYLGTLDPNSRGGIESPAPASRKIDSPELLPLTRLDGLGFRQKYTNAQRVPVTDGEGEEFYTPGGSSMTIGSGIGGAVGATEVENSGGGSTSSSSSSYTSSSSGSGSPRRSVSLSISPPRPQILNPKRTIPKSPELVAVQIIPPARAHSFPSHFPARDSQSPSLATSCSPEIISVRSIGSSPMISGIWDKKTQSPAKTSSPSLGSPVESQAIPPQHCVSVSAPPPPPPRLPVAPLPPKAKHIENPIAPIPPSRRATSELTPLLPTTAKSEEVSSSENVQKTKLKPLHWDKVRASSEHETVWDHLKSSSFKVNEEMIETLFVANAPNPKQMETTRRSLLHSQNQEHRVLDPKRSQNIAISLRALNVTIEEVCEALLEGNVDALGTEVLESLLKMAPSKEEENKLRKYADDDDSPFKLGPAEKFLKAVLGVPFAFKRVDAMLYISNFDSDVDYLKKSLKTLEAACEELRSSRMFLKLLEAVLKTGNRMNVGTNRGEAHAFKLDTLLKLVYVKGTDGKTTLLHFVVQEIVRSEGAKLSSPSKHETPPTGVDQRKFRKLGLQQVSRISSELTNVKKAATMDSEVLHSDVLKLSEGMVKISQMSGGKMDRKFSESMKRFMEVAEEEIVKVQAQESVALSLVKEITEYFHGDSAKEDAHPFRIFTVVRDFVATLDRVCKEVEAMSELAESKYSSGFC